MRPRTITTFLAGGILGAVASFVVTSCAYEVGPFSADRAGIADRPANWAEPISAQGAENLHRVSPGLYRSAQPTAEGFRRLEAMGVKTVVNLRLIGSDAKMLKGTGLGYEHIRAEAWDADDDEVVRFLKIVTDPKLTPVLVHCKHGSDRTGVMCAIYRIVVQGWTRDEAIREMTRGGFGYHDVFDDLVEYIEELDVEKIKRRAGME